MISIRRFNALRSDTFRRTGRSGNDHSIGSAALTRAVGGLLAVLITAPALADTFIIVDQPLPNGDFANGLSDWTVEVSPDPAAPPGAVSIVDGAARLAKGGAYRVALLQDFVAPEGLIALRLRLAELPQFGSTGAFIPEAFDVHVLGSAATSRVAAFRAGASAAANAAAVPAGFSLGPGTTLDGDVLRVELPGVGKGEPLTLIAALVGASTDTVATVAIDDVVLEVEREPPPDPPVQERIEDCELWRDGFEARRGVGVLPRCALGQLGDTGITACVGGTGDDCPADGLPGQDADVGRDAEAREGLLVKLGSGPAGFDFAKLDANGDPVTLSSTEWSCVVDNFSGLIWEVKVDDAADPRHHAHTYTWYRPDPNDNGGLAGTADGGLCVGSACDTAAYVDAINAQALCGGDNWRVPTRAELATLVHAGARSPAVAVEFFPWAGGATWTVTPMAAQPDSAWHVNFDDGRIDVALKNSALPVRLVREIEP
jgi:hypothetical protein